MLAGGAVLENGQILTVTRQRVAFAPNERFIATFRV